MKTSKPKKTKYCKYYIMCDRENDCLTGELCDFFDSNPDVFVGVTNIKTDTFKEIMDDIWNGKTDKEY